MRPECGRWLGTFESLATGYRIIDIHEFEEGGLPRRLMQVTLEKSAVNASLGGRNG